MDKTEKIVIIRLKFEIFIMCISLFLAKNLLTCRFGLQAKFKLITIIVAELYGKLSGHNCIFSALTILDSALTS